MGVGTVEIRYVETDVQTEEGFIITRESQLASQPETVDMAVGAS